MRNSELWLPTKVALTGPDNQLKIPANSKELSPGSTLIATLAAYWYQRNLKLYARGTLLELGCGKMPYRALYANHVENIIATDWPGSLHGQRFVDFSADLTRGIPLSNDAVDTVIASDLLEHIYKPHELLHEIYRIMKPGGYALLNIPFLYWVHEAPHDYYRYTQHALRRMVADSGFNIENLTAFGGHAYVIADIIGKMLQRLPYIGSASARLSQRIVLAIQGNAHTSENYPLMMGLVITKPATTH